MVSTFTPNINLEEPARGDDVGTWDTPVNNNMTLADLTIGGAVTVGLNNSPVVLASAQFQCNLITFNSTLTGSVAITFPSTFKKSYTVRHVCTGSSAFVITLQTTAAGGQVIACRPGNPFQCYNDGTNLFFLNLGTEVGGYWDYAGSSVPAWVSGCTVPPYLNCTGATFSSATYPQLTVILGSTTLPDRRGTAGYTLNQGTGRLTTASGGLDGNTIFATKLTDSVTINTSNLPPYTPSGTVTSSLKVNSLNVSAGVTPVYQPSSGTGASAVSTTSSFSGVPQGGVSAPMSNIGTGTVYGISMIRSA